MNAKRGRDEQQLTNAPLPRSSSSSSLYSAPGLESSGLGWYAPGVFVIATFDG